MTNEQIERLAMDLACGEMNEDMRALFAEYVEEHPEYRQSAAGVDELCRRCRVGLKSTADVPASFKLCEKKAPDPFILVRRAAIVMVAVLVGLLAGRLGRERVTSQRAEVELVQTKAETALASGLQDGFWKEKADALMKPKLWAADTKTQTHETFWGRYRKELSYGKTDTE